MQQPGGVSNKESRKKEKQQQNVQKKSGDQNVNLSGMGLPDGQVSARCMPSAFLDLRGYLKHR